MILEQHGSTVLIETDLLDKDGLPIYTVKDHYVFRVFDNGELAFQDATRYFWDTVLPLIHLGPITNRTQSPSIRPFKRTPIRHRSQ